MNRHERRRRGHRGPLVEPASLKADSNYGVMAGWCSGLENVEEAKTRLHDELIAMMGDRRTGPVTWLVEQGRNANDLLDKLRQGAAGEYADHYRRLDAHLREYGGMLVVAIAEGSL